MKLCSFLIAIFAAFFAGQALACSYNADNTDLDSHSSFSLASPPPLQGRASAGLQCPTLLQVLSNSYIGVTVESSNLAFRHETLNASIPFTLSATPGGPPLPSNIRYEDTSGTLLSLLASQGGQVYLYYSSIPTTGLPAGIYRATVDVRWYHSLCLVGLAALCVPDNSPGLTRSGCILGICLGPITNWGSGKLLQITMVLEVAPDCRIDAPSINFGSAPFPSEFPTISQRVDIRCTAGSTYSVSLDDGRNAVGNTRRMRSGSNFLSYDVLKSTSGSERWGSSSQERRNSSDADVAPGQTTSLINQGYFYRAQVRSDQTAPVGNYSDILQLNVNF